VGEEGRGGGGEMTQTLYVYMNKRKKRLFFFTITFKRYHIFLSRGDCQQIPYSRTVESEDFVPV
jgi:hypothetical protein